MSKSDYYSKQNPHGPWGSTPRPKLGGEKATFKEPNEVKTSGHIEGQSTPGNIKQWSDRASLNSGPKIAPGDGKKTEPAPIRGPLPAD